ncbi:MAG: PDZ domain-containing protein, partial [Ruminiclostridium sp.]
MAVLIKSVTPRSPAAKAGVKAGETLAEINGHPINDTLDYGFYCYDRVIELNLVTRKVKVKKKDDYDDIGLNFETYLMDEKKSCRNKCIFCFIDQLPKGMRDTLYFKDDDSRLSFLQGNYITLTNLSEEDIERIIKMKLNVNVSVHTTNPELRCKMLNNRFAGEVLRYIDMMAKGGITMNCQIVLCRGINDGEELKKTISDLTAL